MLKFSAMSTKTKQKKRSRAAREKLEGLPFSTISEQKEFREKVRRKVVRQLETAKALEELTKHPEYQFFRKKFEQGMRCRYGNGFYEIVHVYMNDEGNVTLLVGTLVKSLSESLIASYYRAYGYIPTKAEQKEDDEFQQFAKQTRRESKKGR